eukprot:3151129-Amphidinium_carterae.1
MTLRYTQEVEGNVEEYPNLLLNPVRNARPTRVRPNHSVKGDRGQVNVSTRLASIHTPPGSVQRKAPVRGLTHFKTKQVTQNLDACDKNHFQATTAGL